MYRGRLFFQRKSKEKVFRSVVKERRKETEKKILGEMEEKNEILSGERLPARSEGVACVFSRLSSSRLRWLDRP